MSWFVEKLTDLFRFFHDDKLPVELAFGEIKSWGFVRGSMERAARLSAGRDVPFGVFNIIGIEHAPRAARTRWPKERLLMEDVSCAFQPIENRASSGRFVSQFLIDRLVFLTARYLAYIRDPWSQEQLYEAVARFIESQQHDALNQD